MASYMREIKTHLLCEHTDCRYVGTFGTKVCYCNYIGIVGHKRPCKATPDCICYEKGEREHHVEQISLKNW